MGSARRVVTSIRLWAIVAVLAIASQPSAMAAEGDEVIPYSRSGADTCLGCHDFSKDSPVHPMMEGAHGDASDSRTPMAQKGCEHCPCIFRSIEC